MSNRDRLMTTPIWLAVLVVAGGFAAAPNAEGQAGSRSVRHSSAGSQKKARTSARTPGTPATRPGNPATRPGNPATRPGTPARRSSARAGYRAGYRHGSYHSWYNARRSWYRWRTVTGLFRLGVYLATRPTYTTTVVVTGTTYYYTGGVYYVSSGSGYVVVHPPPGAVVYSVPTYTTVVYAGTTEYLYVNGTYYVPTTVTAEQPPQPPPPPPEPTTAGDQDPSDIPMIDDEQNYEVVTSPAGATVPYLPEDADEEIVLGKTYFVYAGTYYRPYASDGETIYMVVADPTQV